jgi:hypothetical protein
VTTTVVVVVVVEREEGRCRAVLACRRERKQAGRQAGRETGTVSAVYGR